MNVKPIFGLGGIPQEEVEGCGEGGLIGDSPLKVMHHMGS